SSRPRARSSPWSRRRSAPARASPSCGGRKACPSSWSIVTRPDPYTDTQRIQSGGRGMPRYENMTPEQMTPEQRQVVANVTAGPRGSATRGPFMAWLPSPKFADLAQALGAQTRFGSSLPAKHYEIAILMVAQHWRAQFEWYAHARLAKNAGIS